MLKLIRGQLINDQTGEVLDLENMSDQELSEHLKSVSLRFKALEGLYKVLSSALKSRLSDDQTKFAGFWDIRWIKDKFTGIDLKQLEAEDPEHANLLKKNYGKYTTYPEIRFPKL